MKDDNRALCCISKQVLMFNSYAIVLVVLFSIIVIAKGAYDSSKHRAVMQGAVFRQASSDEGPSCRAFCCCWSSMAWRCASSALRPSPFC